MLLVTRQTQHPSPSSRCLNRHSPPGHAPFRWSFWIHFSKCSLGNHSFTHSFVRVAMPFLLLTHSLVRVVSRQRPFCWSFRAFTHSMVRVASRSRPLFPDVQGHAHLVGWGPLHYGSYQMSTLGLCDMLSWDVVAGVETRLDNVTL